MNRVPTRLYTPSGGMQLDADEGLGAFVEAERDETGGGDVQINAFAAGGEGAILQMTLGREQGISLLAQLAAALAFPE